MGSNENKKEDNKAQAFSWWCDGSHNRSQESQWLQTNLSELDEKIKVMLSIIEEDGDTFAERAEMYYKRRPQLIKVVEDLHKSYRSLAEKYDHLRSDHHFTTNPAINRNPGSFSPFRSLRQIQNHETKLVFPQTPTSQSSTTILDHDTCSDHVNKFLVRTTDHDQVPCKNVSEAKRGETAKTTVFETDMEFGGDFEDLELKEKVMWSEKEVSELIEDHLKQQAELIRRNEEKREKINELRCQINKLLDENGVLRGCLANPKVDHKSKPKQSKSSPLFLGKLTGCAG